MSITITLYNFSKRENSTKQPTGGVEVPAVFKNATSKYNPSFILNIENPLNYNYIKYGNIYYYVNDVVMLSNNHAEYQCEVDVLATWKTQIGNVTAYTLFSTGGYDIGLPDNRLSSNDSVIVNSNKKQIFSNLAEGYVVTYVGEQSTTNPCVGLTAEGVTALMDAVQSNAFAELLGDPSNALSKILSDCSSAITSCRYMPVIYTVGAKKVVLAGGYDTGITGGVVDEKTPNNFTVDIPWNFPQGDFRNRSQYTSLFVYLPGYGFIQLNTDDYIGYESLQIDALLDCTSGGLTYLVGHNTRAECNISTPIQISTTTQGNMLGAMVSAGGALLSVATGNVAGAIGGAFGSITSSMMSNVGSVGSQGSHSSYSIDRYVRVICVSHDTNIDPSTLAVNYGRPCNKVKKISAGYNECTNASVNCNAPQYLKDKINSYLNGGLYYE